MTLISNTGVLDARVRMSDTDLSLGSDFRLF